MKKIICLFVITLLSGCCFYKQKVILEEPDFRPGSRVLVYEDSGGIAGKLLRGALRKQGIKVLKYANQNVLNVNTKSFSKSGISETDTNIQFYDKYYGTPYIIEIDASKRNDVVCLAPWDDGCVWEISVEIADLITHEAVYAFSLSGFDERCGYCSGNIFDDAAELIANFWNRQSSKK